MTLRHEQAPTGIPSAVAANVAAQIPTLVSDALLLRAPTVEDFPLYADILCTERGQYMGGPLSRNDAWWDFVQLASGWIAFEAAQMAREFAFDTLNLSELASYIHKDNARSIALAERLGAKRTVHDDTMLAYIHTSEAVQ
jgi:RimJ/RimL family protein N-acetyltransferase